MKSSGSASLALAAMTSCLTIKWCWPSGDDCGIGDVNICETDVPNVPNSIASLSKMDNGSERILSLKSSSKSVSAPSTGGICSGQEGEDCWTSGRVKGLLLPNLARLPLGRCFLVQMFKAGHGIFDWLFLQALCFFRGPLRVPCIWRNLQVKDNK